jgi:tetratricopeptide (TPR) repeat protein
LEQARSLVERGRFEQAEALFSDRLATEASDVDALYGLGFCRLARGLHAAAISPLRRAVEVSPNHGKAWNALGSALLALDRSAEAADAFARAIASGGDPQFLVNHAVAARKAGRPREALTSLDRILERAPSAAPAHLLRAEALIDIGDTDAARDAADRARTLAPDDAGAHAAVGRIELIARRPGPAIESLAKAAALSPADADVLVSLGHARALAEDAAGASEAYRRAETVGPPSAALLAELALGWERLNTIPEASRLAETAIRKDPEGYKPNLARAVADRRAGRLEDAADRLATLAPRAETSGDATPLFALGQVLDRLGRTEEAWAALRSANALAAAKPRASELAEKERRDVARASKAVERLGSVTLERDSDTGPPPIFVVGFPRSGTTLVDRLLGAHPEIGVLEEKPLLERVEARFAALVGPYPDALPLADRSVRDRLRALYRDDVRTLGIDAPTVLDKHPLNMKRLGLMRLLFPEAPVVLIERHPMDVVLSCFMQDFRLNQAMARLTDVAEIARAYVENRRLFGALVDCLSHEPVRVRYEDLLKNPRRGLGPVLTAVGLGWTPEMDDFQTVSVNGKVVRSASYAQVTETVTDRSIGRWRRYHTHLSEAERILGADCEDLGYAL